MPCSWRLRWSSAEGVESSLRAAHPTDSCFTGYWPARPNGRIPGGQDRMSANSTRQPAIFLPHGGGPCFFMDWTWGSADTWNATQHFLEGLAATLPAPPKALLVVSGHWEEPVFTASAAAKPELIFARDFMFVRY